MAFELLSVSFATVAALVLALFAMGFFSQKPQFEVDGRTVVLTGGSQGMGKGLAKLFAQKGANVVVVARNVKKLEAAVEYMKSAASKPETQRFHYISADVTKLEENERIIAEVTAWNQGNPPDIVWANAGFAHPSLFLDTPMETFHSQMDINYWAAAYLAHATLKQWLRPLHNSASSADAGAPATRTDGHKPARHFIMTSSVSAFLGLAGYTPYSPCKAALRNLADTLRSEVQLYRGAAGNHSAGVPEVKIHIVLPATILSPGFEEENKVKHPVTLLLEEGDPQQTEDEVAAASMKALERGDYIITTQFIGDALRAGAMGGSPRSGLLGIRDMLFGAVIGLVWLFIGPDMERKVRNFGKKNGVGARNKV